MAASTAGGKDLTQGPIASTLLLFAIPTLASNILQSLNGSINAIWVGRFLGPQALAATANANIIMFLMFSVVFGFGMAATVMIGQSMGQRDVDAARRAFGSAVGFCMGLAVVVSTAGWLARPLCCGCWRPRRKPMTWRWSICASSSSPCLRPSCQ